MPLPCGHSWLEPPVVSPDGKPCPFCAIRHVPFHAARWGGEPPQNTSPVIRVNFCGNRQLWDWSVSVNGQSIASGSNRSEQEAHDEAHEAAFPHLFRPARRHLLYHVLPVAGNGTWQRNIDQIKARLPLFNGRKIIAVCTDSDGPIRLDNPAAVAEMLRDTDCEFIYEPNSRPLREVQTWRPLWAHLEKFADTDDVVFYAHAKGVTRPVNPGVTVHEWTRMAYASLLDFWPAVEESLGYFPVTGSFKKVGFGFPGSKSAWHYSGSFFWSRCREVFLDGRWKAIDGREWGNEAWPGLHFSAEQAGCIFKAGTVPSLDMYNGDLVFKSVIPEFREWCVSNNDKRTRYVIGNSAVSLVDSGQVLPADPILKTSLSNLVGVGGPLRQRARMRQANDPET